MCTIPKSSRFVITHVDMSVIIQMLTSAFKILTTVIRPVLFVIIPMDRIIACANLDSPETNITVKVQQCHKCRQEIYFYQVHL